MTRTRTLLYISLLALASPGLSTLSHATPYSAHMQMAATQLADLSLEELLQVTITSVSKREETYFEAPDAIHVITRDDIRHSGVTSIPEALRLAPGVHVAQIDANKWSVSIRGFGDRFANKLLVLQDGRTIYNPTFGGVYWNIQDIMLEDIERIEVIRGPSSTLWGANAVNGVINIITRAAKDTTGGLVTAGGGTWEKGFGAFRYGAKVGDAGYIRGYARYFSRDRQTTAAGSDQEGSWDNWSGGFRSDWTPTTSSNLTLQGDLYRSRAGAGLYSGGNLLGRISHAISPTSDATVQLYYMRSEQQAVTNPGLKYQENRDTIDLDVQHSLQASASHRLLWGAGYRYSQDRTGNAPDVRLLPGSRDEHLASFFIQDEITLVPDRFKAIAGLRIEHNDYTGFELQPTGRLLWTPDNRHTLWAAVTRAVRTPTRVQDSIDATIQRIPSGGLGPGMPEARIKVFGSPQLLAESLLAYELGHRYRHSGEFWTDLALFYNDYDRLSGLSGSTPFMEAGYLVLPYAAANNVKGESWGAEISASWRPHELFSLTASYSWLDMRIHSNEPLEVRNLFSQLGSSPEQQFGLRSGITLLPTLRLDLWLRYVDRLTRDAINDYAELDVRIAWAPVKNLELALVGQNLLHAYHNEFGNDAFGSPATRSQRGMYGKLTWKF